jgi:transmembrane sensor
MAWRGGYLVFSGEPLSEANQQVNRYSAVTPELGDPEPGALAIGGRFRTGDLGATLDILRSQFGLLSRQLTENSIRLESECLH